MQNAVLVEKSGRLTNFLAFRNIEIEENKFRHHKTLIFLKDVDIEKVLVSNKISLGEKSYKYYKYNTIWDKVSADIKKEFGNKPVFNKELLKSKIKSHGDEVTDFYDKEVAKVDSNHTCLAVISLDYVLKKEENYYPELFLKV